MLLNLNHKCSLVQSFSTNDKRQIINGLYLECNYIIIQILVVNEKNGYYVIDEDNYETRDRKIFGDTPRAFSKFNKNELIVENSNKYYVPNDLNKFILEYEHSKYISCKNQNHPPLLKSDINTEIADVLKYVTETITSFNKIYWLDGPTLLGYFSLFKFI